MRALPRTGRALLIAVTAAGCTRSPAPQVTSAPARAAAHPVASADPAFDYRDPGQVCQRFAAAIYRRDTDTDRGPVDAYRRAMAYATADLAAAVAAQPDTRDPAWALWRSHHARTDPTATAWVDPHPLADTAADAWRGSVVSFTPTGRDGWHGLAERHGVYCTLRGDAGRWRVVRYELFALGEAGP